jgi:formate dehydrogenase iron-sulfur subunit
MGFIPRAVPVIAEALNLSRAEVHGVVSYYPHLREQPHGRTLIQICRAEACKSRGGDALFAHATLGCQAHGTSADGSVTLEPVYCLGLCAQSPAVMVDESEVHARMTADRLDALLEEIQQKRLETKADEAQAAIENEAVAATRIYVPRVPRPWPWARMRWPRRCSASASARPGGGAGTRLARLAVAGDPGRSRDCAGPRGLRPGSGG